MSEETRTLLDAAQEHLPRAGLQMMPDNPLLVSVTETANGKVRFEDLEKFAAAPRRVRQLVRHETPQSFCGYVNAFRDASRTRIFASLEKRQVVAQMDFHAPAGEDPASWRTHRAVYPAQFCEAFDAWASVHGKPMAQREFAEFLEDRAEDAVAPEPADLMEVAAKFEAVRNVEFRSAVNLSTGERQFKYDEKDSQGGGITCPKAIRLRTPVFYGSDPVEWSARLAYSISDGALAFTVRIHRFAELLDAEFERLCDVVAVDCPETPVHRGVAD